MSNTKARIIARHAANTLLQTPRVPSMRVADQDLSADQPTVAPDAAIRLGSLSALERGETHYAEVPGIGPLREKVAAFLQRLGLADHTAAQVVITAGIQENRFLVVQVLGALTGHMGLPEVVHPGARMAAGLRPLEVKTIPVDAEHGYLPTPAALRAAIQDGCKLIYLESPSRLTGAAYSRAQVEEIAGILVDGDAYAVVDQGLGPWMPGYASLASVPGMYSRVTVIGEVFPGVGLESWPVGYMSARPEALDPLRAQKQLNSICTTTPSQYAALAAADVYANQHEEQVGRLAQIRSGAAQAIEQAGGKTLAGGAVSILAVRGAPSGPGSAPVAERLSRSGYTFADGAAFGAEGVIRLAVTPDAAIARAASTL